MIERIMSSEVLKCEVWIPRLSSSNSFRKQWLSIDIYRIVHPNPTPGLHISFLQAICLYAHSSALQISRAYYSPHPFSWSLQIKTL